MGAQPAKSFGNGRYIIRRKLGEGGQKVVYLVHDTQLDRDCAVASLENQRSDDKRLTRLVNEARAMARLTTHENIVTIHDIGEERGTPFLVCEYVAGGELEHHLEAGALRPERAVAIAKDLCRALSAAHEAGVVHRDVKPANVWLTEGGRAKLGDFGLALALDESRVTAEGTIVGTPYYLAPEQALTGDVDARSDIYALGCVIYQMLTGSPPYVGNTVTEVVAQHLHATPPAPSRVVPDVPRALDDIVLGMLAKRPDDRPSSTAEVLASLEQATETSRPAAKQTTATALGDIREASFVGRTQELDTLKAALDQALAGQGASREIAGEAGVGKSRLVRELTTYARLKSIPVLVGGCDAADGAPPYLPFVEALDGVASDLPPADLGHQRTILAQLLPSLSAAATVKSGADRYEVFRAIVSLIRHLAEPRGLVLVIEDVHWADKPTLLLLEYLAAHIGDVKVLVLSTYRDVEVIPGHPLGATLANLRRERSHERVSLKRLEREAARALVTALAPLSESSVDAIVEQTEGHPLFIEEVLKHLVEEGVLSNEGAEKLSSKDLAELGVPEGIRDVIGRRLSRLSAPCKKMLTRAAALPNAITWTLLRAICGEDEDDLLDLLDEALAARIVRERRQARDGAYEFTHALIRQALYEELSVPRRARLHVRIGEAIEGLYADDLDPFLSELAYHFFQASVGAALDKAVDYAMRAGKRSMERMAFEDAARQYERALEALEESDDEASRETRAELHRLRGIALSVVCLWGDARAEFERGLELLPPGRDEDKTRLLIHSALSNLWTMNMPGVVQTATEALALARETGRPDYEGAATAFLGLSMASEGDLEGSHQQYERARALVPKTSDPVVAHSITLGSQTLFWLGRYEETLQWVDGLEEVSREHHDGTIQMILMPIRGLSLAASGKYREARRVFDASARFGRDHGIRGLLARTISMSAGNLIETFDFDAGAARAQESLDLGRTHQFVPTLVSSLLDLTFIDIDRGDVGAAEARLPEIFEQVKKASGWHYWVFDMRRELVSARFFAAKEQWEEGLVPANAIIERSRSIGRVKYEASGLAVRAALLNGLGRREEAIADLKASLSLVRTMDYPALMVRYGGDLLALDGSDALRDEVRGAVDAIATELDGEARQTFESSEMVRRAVR